MSRPVAVGAMVFTDYHDMIGVVFSRDQHADGAAKKGADDHSFRGSGNDMADSRASGPSDQQTFQCIMVGFSSAEPCQNNSNSKNKSSEFRHGFSPL